MNLSLPVYLKHIKSKKIEGYRNYSEAALAIDSCPSSVSFALRNHTIIKGAYRALSADEVIRELFPIDTSIPGQRRLLNFKGRDKHVY